VSSQIVLGLGGTVDYEIEWDAAVLEQAARDFGVTAAELDTAVAVVDERSLVVSVLSFLREGRGGERFVATPAALEAFSARFRYATTLGGTCVRAALAMARLHVPSTVHLVSIDDTVRRMLPPGISYLSSATADSTEPHVIVQYPAGVVVDLPDQRIVAPHHNRLIYVNDLPNRELVLAPQLGDLVADARVFLASGFNTIQDATILEDRLAQVSAAIARMSADGVAIFEDAGSHDVAHGRRVRDAMAAVVDVYGLNEDELFGYLGAPVDLLDVSAVEHALRAAATLISAPTLVVHTKHWAVALGEQAVRWRGALDGGVTMAGTRFRIGDALTDADYADTRRLPRQERAVAFAADLERRFDGQAVCVPAYHLDVARPTTIGLGDSFVGGFIAGLVSSDAGSLAAAAPAASVDRRGKGGLG
jgi:ADP-dependent phosphofructokinase/glucokinase